jgi:UDP-N-acetylglucosamine 2-epimerase
MKAAIIIGTRPQIIKTAPLMREAAHVPGFDLSIIHTGQHYDFEMSKVFFNELELGEPLVNLGVGSGSHGAQTGRMLIELEKTFSDFMPDLVLVPGDTNSTLAGALAAAKMHIPVGHIESGARSFDMSMPEEVNRRVTDHCSSVLFTVSENCRRELLKENISEERIKLVGDTMYESIEQHMDDIDECDILDQLDVDEEYIVLTTHRAENVDNPERLGNIVQAVRQLDRKVVFPCHPRTKVRLESFGCLDKLGENVLLIEPVGYFEMLKLVKEAEMVLTDSGGIQKEAFWLNTPCVTLRDNTEWVETIEQGMNRLVGADTQSILDAVHQFENNTPEKTENPYDFGGASKKIVETCLGYLW